MAFLMTQASIFMKNTFPTELMEMADVIVKIPMDGHLESLNASVAAGILMYETKRKRD